MKKLWMLMLICLAFIAKGQDTTHTYEKGKNYFMAGYGFLVPNQAAFLDNQQTINLLKGITGPFYLKYDHSFTNSFSMGINLAYEKQYAKIESDDSYGYHNITERYYQSGSIIFKFNGHILSEPRVDAYYGIGMGYRYFQKKEVFTNTRYHSQYIRYTYDQSNYGTTELPLAFECTIGMKYLFTSHLGAYFETGIAKSVVQLGLVYKM